MGAIIQMNRRIVPRFDFMILKKIWELPFQLQTINLDLLETQKVGKQVGAILLKTKKTYLYLKALELGTPDQLKD